MEKKPCPVDRGKLLIGLECCREGSAEVCRKCPYFSVRCDTDSTNDALAYIYYLEEQLNAKEVKMISRSL